MQSGELLWARTTEYILSVRHGLTHASSLPKTLPSNSQGEKALRTPIGTGGDWRFKDGPLSKAGKMAYHCSGLPSETAMPAISILMQSLSYSMISILSSGGETRSGATATRRGSESRSSHFSPKEKNTPKTTPNS